ncbi:MAG: hypothetical protein ACPGN8_02375 [Candidatus Thalassarchaeaceae archaeon]
MSTTYILVRCSCGTATGAILGRRASCSRCGSRDTLSTESTFNSPSKLAEAVMLANTPRELRSEMVNRINSSYKNQNNQLEKSDGGKVLGILRKAMKNDGSIERMDVDEQAIKEGFDEPEISTILSKAEAEGILVRAGKDVWKLIEP